MEDLLCCVVLAVGLHGSAKILALDPNALLVGL